MIPTHAPECGSRVRKKLHEIGRAARSETSPDCGARSDKVYRFFPAIIDDGDMARVHGTGERLAIESFALGVRYFHQLIKNSDKL